MKIKSLAVIVIVLVSFNCSFGQKGPTSAHYFGEPLVVDSSSTIIIPTHYNSDFIRTNKIALWGVFYANIVFYDFTSDTSKKLFADDTFIIGFGPANNYDRYNLKRTNNNYTSQWIFYQVKNMDRNKNGRIDNKDPAILYVSDIRGDNLRPLTSGNENVVGIDIFEKQGFALIKVQRDRNQDGNFENDDKDFYYTRLDLKTLTFGKNIEL